MANRALHILLVEDNPADARLFELLFERSGEVDGGAAIIQRAETVGAALHTLGTAHPCDVVLLDLTLPDSEGLDTLRAVRERFPALPIVVLSGLSDQTIALRAVREGAQDYLVKGRIDAELLSRAVRYAIERKSAQSDRDRAQEALAISEGRLRLVTEATTDGIWDWNIATGDLYWSDRLSQMVGAPPPMPRSDPILDLVHPEDRPPYERAMQEALAPGGSALKIEVRLQRAPGQFGDFRVSGKVVRDEAGAPVRMAGSVADITARKRAEEALRESERRFQSFMDNSPAIAFMKDECGRYVYLNAVFEKVFHRRTADLIGRTDTDMWSPEVARTLQATDAAVLRGNHPIEVVEVIPHDDGLHEWLSFKFPITEANQRRFVCGVSVDITERRRAEQALREADEQLRQSQKMEAVGQLASGVAHDFNNLLTAIRGYASLARNTLHEDHPALESLDQVEEASRQATGVAGALLTFARRTRSEKSEVNVAQAVESATRLFRRTLPPSVRLVVDTAAAEDLWVMADSTQLQQVVINLALNAKDAIASLAEGNGKPEGTLTVSAQPARAPRPRPIALRPRPTNVHITVRDTGIGMTPEIKARIFEPFFTTKPRGHGTGLGLAVIHGIVQDHGGTITVESAPGAGSSFTVSLPLTAAPAMIAEPRPAEPGITSAGGLALLAEDNQLVRGLLASMLAALGYEIAHASSADQALKVAADIDLPIDLLVVDHDLPGVGGMKLLADIRAQGQNTRAVVVTSAAAADEPVGPGIVLLRKPFQLADLRRAIAQLEASSKTETPA